MSQNKKLPEYLTIQDVIKSIGITIQTFYRWRKLEDFKDLKFEKINDRLSLRSQDLLDYIHSRIDNKDCVKITDEQQYYEGLAMITPTDLAQRLRIHEWTIHNWNTQKAPHRIPNVDMPCSPRYRVVDVNMWLNKYSIGPDDSKPDILKDVFLIPEEARKYLGMSKSTINRWVKICKLPYIKMGRLHRYRISAINCC